MGKKRETPRTSMVDRIEQSVTFLKPDHILYICVAAAALLIAYTMLNHAGRAPRGLMAGPWNPMQASPVPGRGPVPPLPAAFNPPAWKTLYICPRHGGQNAVFYADALPYCPVCNQIMMVNP